MLVDKGSGQHVDDTTDKGVNKFVIVGEWDGRVK